MDGTWPDPWLALGLALALAMAGPWPGPWLSLGLALGWPLAPWGCDFVFGEVILRYRHMIGT